ncbi:MAG TPA: Clp protease N-terminal domain-containing protein [Pirellulales bacterium]|nr:Clp protease N-terminal domain-containing protein [Pirellulales bacterium]
MAKSPYGNRYTDRAVKAMQFAHEESNRLQQDLVSPEHILLGLLREGAGVGINALSASVMAIPWF